MKKIGFAVAVVFGTMVFVPGGFAQGEYQGQGQVVVTVLPKHDGAAAGNVSPQDAKLKVNGKESSVTKLVPLTGDRDGLELVVLIDGASRASLGSQMDDIAHFIKSLPPNARATIAYMQNGRAVLAGPLSDDHAQVLKGLHIPSGSAGSNGSPYFCLSDLAKKWPSEDARARREVLMVSDGVDQYNLRFDPSDQYVQAAIADSVRARLVVYSIYWRGHGRIDNTQYENNAGQSLLLTVTDATGGKSFWEGTGNPVSFEPFLDELTRRLRNQYELSFVSPLKGKPGVEDMKLKFSVPGSEVDAPLQVFVGRAGAEQN